MAHFNDRQHELPATGIQRKVSILVEFPESRLEAIVVQWSHFRPTVLIQLMKDPKEPIQFPGKRPDIPGNDSLPKDAPSALDLPLRSFVDGTSGRLFEQFAFNADLLLSTRAFSLLQPEPDLILPLDSLIECREEALRYLKINDEPWTEKSHNTPVLH